MFQACESWNVWIKHFMDSKQAMIAEITGVGLRMFMGRKKQLNYVQNNFEMLKARAKSFENTQKLMKI